LLTLSWTHQADLR
jgi:hypothetical protein